MGTDPQGRTFSPDRSGAKDLRIPGLPGSRGIQSFGAERPRNRRETASRLVLATAAGAVQGVVEDAISFPGARQRPKVSHRRTMRRDLSRDAALVELCLARGCPLEDAKELVQEAHLRLFSYKGFVRDTESLLRLIVINLSINYYHRERSRASLFKRVDRLDRDGILIDPTPDPERTLAAEQQLDRVVSLVSAMSPRTCQIFIAQRGGYSHEEVAAGFAIKPRTVEKHVASATSALAEMMPDTTLGVPLPRMSR